MDSAITSISRSLLPSRVGLVVPSSNTTMETELPELLRRREHLRPGERFTFHSARVRMTTVTPEALRAMNAEVDRAAAELADLRPDIVASACLVAIMAEGPGRHLGAEAELAAGLEAGGSAIPALTSAGALVRALQAMRAARVAIVTPYMKPLTQLVADYLEDAGIQVHDALSLEVSDNRSVARLSPAALADHWRRLDLTGCDALVLSACVQMPSLAAIQAVEDASGICTLSAATATAWELLARLGRDAIAPDAGALLREVRP